MTGLIGIIIGVYFIFMIFDRVFVRLFRIREVLAVWYSFIMVFLFFIIYYFLDKSTNTVSLLIMQLIISIIFLTIFIKFADKDDKEKTRLLNLTDEANINLSELVIISNKSEKKLKRLIRCGYLSTKSGGDNEMYFEKGKALHQLKTIKKK